MLGLIISILFAPGVIFVTFVILLATFGKSFGVRRLYIKFLLAVFEVSYLAHFQYCSHDIRDFAPDISLII